MRSVPGNRRSTRRGDCPDDTLEGAVVLVCIVLILSSLNKLCGPPKELGAYDSTGEIGCGATMKGDDCGTAYMGSGGYEVGGNDVCSGRPCMTGSDEGGGA